MKPIVSVRNVSKRYHVGRLLGARPSLGEAVAAAVKSPFARFNGNSTEETLWALKDISFDALPGEVIGIIGRNGAGKSTLLRILARITKPTEGEIDIFGRLGTLLEIGTGFHPDLTGLENIFLNGTILGMKVQEIKRKFDEIVAFSEVGRFLETPVKHYSSGMYLRLAFSIAAHFEPEVLLLDEVIAVGDLAFQKKCFEKMRDVSREGRTIFLVSHNLASIQSMCQRVFLLRSGHLYEEDDPQKVISVYVNDQGPGANGLNNG
ncbi:MAG TPA: ABC transporter ATP-binding protein [Pyrinomonadaceae bacterium]